VSTAVELRQSTQRYCLAKRRSSVSAEQKLANIQLHIHSLTSQVTISTSAILY